MEVDLRQAPGDYQQPGLLITIDGPAGSGKSSVAREVARRLGFTYVTTGAIYRTLAMILDESGLAADDRDALHTIVQRLETSYSQDSATGQVYLDGREISSAIKAPRISELASRVAADAHVRQALLPIQRAAVAACKGAVVDGRDMGTVVFPSANLKVFLTASADERARRRMQELIALGKPVDAGALLAEIQVRDERDSGRAAAPLKPATDATVIDSTDVVFEDVVARIIQLCRDKNLI